MKLRNYHRWFWGLLLAAVALRLGVMWEFLANNPFAEVLLADDYVYWLHAGWKADGVWLPDDPFFTAPLYPYLLGGLRWLGGGLSALFWLQLAFNVLAMLLVASTARLRFGDLAGIVALVLFGFSWELVVCFTRVMPETLQLLLVALLLRAWVGLSHQSLPGWGGITATGLLLGLLALSWQPALLLLPVFILWLLLRRGTLPRRIGGAVAAGLLAAVVIAPAAWHNWRTGHTPIPVSVDVGISMAMGNNEQARGLISPIKGVSPDPRTMPIDMQRYYRAVKGDEGSWSQIDALFRGKAYHFWREHAREGLLLLGHKLWWFLTSTRYDLPYAPALMREHGLYQALVLAPIEVPWLMGLALLGFIACRRALPELSTIAVALIACLLYYYTARYRLPAVPGLVILSSGAMSRWSRLPLKEWLKWLIALLPLPLMVLNYYTGLGRTDFLRDATTYQVSQAWMESGDMRVEDGVPEEASGRYEKAIRARPDYLLPHLRLGELHASAGRLEQAVNAAEAGIPLVRDNLMLYELKYNLYREQGRYDKALEVLEAAIKAHPKSGELYQARLWLLATCVDDPESVELAIRTFRDILRDATGPARPAIMSSLALALAHAGKNAEARQLANEAVRIAAEDPQRYHLSSIRQITFPVRAGKEITCQAGAFKLPPGPGDRGFVIPMRQAE